VSPPLEQARYDWIGAFHQHVAALISLPRLVASRFQVFASETSGPRDYESILHTIDNATLREPFVVIDSKIGEAKQYAQQWLQYQALWDASSAELADKLGRDISKWRQLLMDVKAARSTIDTYDEEKVFGPIVVNHRLVQNKVNLKYDTWQRECQQRFSGILLEEMKVAHNDLISLKSKLESIQLEGPTKDVIIGIEVIMKTKASLPERSAMVNELEESEKLLFKQRFQLPPNWLNSSNVVGVFGDMKQILERRANAVDQQLPSLQLKIREEDALVQQRCDELVQTWETTRPSDGSLKPMDVLQSLGMFSNIVTKTIEDSVRLRSAKETLGLDFIADNRLNFILQEINDFREAWNSSLPSFEKLQRLRDQLIKETVPTKVRKSLDEITNDLRALPGKVRSYSCVEYLQDSITRLLNMQTVLRDLCTEALKDRHWKTLLQGLNLKVFYHELTLGLIWETNLLPHKKFIQDILSSAQGELALEQYLKELREYWVSAEMTLALRDGVRLVTGWDVLFTTLEDNLNSLASLKQSPYYRNVPEFQEDTINWESRLTNLRAIFEVWVEVQRKWVYLRGIFKNPDIKAQLPAQFTKFKSIDNEFLGLSKRVSTKPSVLDLLQIDNLARQLERQDSTMTIIQKALGEYLEKQRHIFPRFYFVNNDDLVEIIGNSNEPAKIIAHLSKMFAAITTIELSGQSNTDSADLTNVSSSKIMCSKEGERVEFSSPIDVTAGVKEWLAALEQQMQITIANLLKMAHESFPDDTNKLLGWISQYPAQVVILCSQVQWTASIEMAISISSDLNNLSNIVSLQEKQLRSLSECVLQDLEISLRRKCEQLLTEMVHQRDVSRILLNNKIANPTDFGWIYHLRFYWSPKSNSTDIKKQLRISMSNATFYYGFEYLGIGERLVQTPLTDRCYLTLTQALHFRMGANPFGPAGTGKTESVKMLGSQLGRFVLVFNCDSSFDYAAMGRIFAGLCQVGAWGCFDEFNRLEERILSAVSQQILTIQRGLLLQQDSIELLGTPCKLNKDVGIFVTLNPGYAGRSNLPDNLKQLFRAVAMVVPDRKIIAQVMLFAQGIVTAEELAGKIVLLFTMCEEQLSDQSHYDFGLRALKSVLTGAGDLKRIAISRNSSSNDISRSMEEIEMNVLIRSTCDSILTKLVSEDIPLFVSLLQAVFPGSELPAIHEEALVEAVRKVCEEDSLEYEEQWVEKILQLKLVLDMRHGVMLVGPSASGKSTAWRTLLKAMAKVDGRKGEYFVIDPKSIKKDKLYGSLDPNTLEWSDGVFTKTLRRLSELSTVRGGAAKRSWIIFDGDVDPEWAENLNSLLDDNKVLTLPTGDRLKVPNNVRIMMEVDTLKHATLATVSRCGMVWFAANTIPLEVAFKQQIRTLRKAPVQLLEFGSLFPGMGRSPLQEETKTKFLDFLAPQFTSNPGIVGIAMDYALSSTHVMEPTPAQLLATLNSVLSRGLALAVDYNEANSNFPMSDSHLEQFAGKWLLYSLIWAFGGSMSAANRAALGDLLIAHSNFSMDMPNNSRLIDCYVSVADGKWAEWSGLVPRVEIESHKVTSSDVVITTTDTVRHTEVLKAWLSSHRPLILCGPPGSGKTMTLTSVLEAMPDFILASLNFSSSTTPDLILKTFAQYCEVVDSPDGLVMQPSRQSYRENQWLVIFCDEINLPEQDEYGTQRVIMFLRQLVEMEGYWNHDCKWVSLRRIQFVGACNPPTDAGRVMLSERFLRHAPLLLVDYPAENSLKQIYRTFNHALLKLHPNLKGATDPLNNAMVEFYLKNQAKFTPDVAPQYVYSPRELSRWVRAMYEAMQPLEAMTMDELVRLWGHEALRLFHDRLVTDEEKQWCDKLVDEVAASHFSGVDITKCLQRPMLYSNWLKKTYQSTDRDDLRTFLAARLKVFYEEELDVPLVIFDDVLEHVLRIDNVLRHPMGHMLLVGESGVGKTVLSRFVSWMNGLSVFQIKANNRYNIEQFDEDLRTLFRRVGVDGEKICFIFDEGNVLSSAFLERMNSLLASGEVRLQ
jgi:dynein heavy chain 1